MNVDSETIEWLLEEDNPSLRYRTLRELLGKPADDPHVLQAQAAILEYAPVKELLAKMQPNGTWLQKNPRTHVVLGDGVEYGSYATTHFCLAYLAELGLNRSHPQVEKAAERYLSLQQADGDWWLHLSCLIGYNLRTFIQLGYRQDWRVQRAVDLMLQTHREDGGYLCDFHAQKYKTKPTKSCIRGCAKMLLAFSEMPEYWQHPRCEQLLEYFLRRGGIFRSTAPNTLIRHDILRLSFPFTWGTSVWEILYAFSKMGYGNDVILHTAWDRLAEKTTSYGRYLLDWTPGQAPWKVGAQGIENKWVTFYVIMAHTYRAGKLPLPALQG